jgi:5'-nucleotidase
MRLLLTNDDGYDAEGLQAWIEVLEREHECWVVAPDGGRSCCSHAVTNADPLLVRQVGARHWTVSGTPADCVRIGLLVLGCEPHWVLSGVNHGGNLGIDTLFSGTVAAAREASLLNRPAMAFSQYMRRDIAKDWHQTALRAKYVLDQIQSRSIGAGQFWNVNLPAIVPEVLKDGRIDPSLFTMEECELEVQPLLMSYERVEPDPETANKSDDRELFLYQSNYQMRPRGLGSDVDRCFRGAATITRLHAF